jgi:hypothetical protein
MWHHSINCYLDCFRMLNLGVIPHDNLWHEATQPMYCICVKPLWQLIFLPLFVRVSICGTQ